MGTPPFYIFIKENNFCDFMFASLDGETRLKVDSYQKKDYAIVKGQGKFSIKSETTFWQESSLNGTVLSLNVNPRLVFGVWSQKRR